MTPKNLKISYWVVLVLFTLAMLTSIIPSFATSPEGITYFTKVLKLPEYLLGFTAVMKSLGLMALYIPNIPRIKEWTFAGFTFNMIGAWYCNFRGTDSFSASSPLFIFLFFVLLLYYLYSKVTVLSKL
ncbi:MAG: DoxX family protein [Spirosomataceae bacterium]